MDNTIKQLLIFEDSEFYSLTHAGRHKMTEEELEGIKPGFVLIISDSELFYTTMEFPDAPKRKLNLFIGNYLMGSFPQALCEKFCYFVKDDKILIGIFNAAFTENFEKYEKIFSKASYITSPLTSVYSSMDTFNYLVDGAGMTIEDGLISSSNDVTETVEPDWSPDPSAKLTLPFVKNRSAAINIYRVPAAVLIVCYFIFIAGDYFRLQAETSRLERAEQALESIYAKAGAADSKDPYGKLLALAGGSEESGKYKTLFALETVSRAHNSSITTELLEIKGNNVTCQGTSTDYTFLEEFTKQLTERTGKEAQIVDTVQKEIGIGFTVRFEI